MDVNQQQQQPQIQPISMLVPLSSRDGTLAKDGLMRNVFVDIQGDGKKWLSQRPGLSSYLSFAGGGAGVSQGLFFNNGFLVACADNVMARINSSTSSGYAVGGAWNNTFNAPWSGRRGHTTVVFRDNMYVIGGTYDGVNNLRDVWSTADGQNWTQCVAAAPWGARTLQQACVFNNRLYIMGGTDSGVAYADVWVTDDGVTWSLITPTAQWPGRSAFALSVFNNGMYVLGGNSNVGVVNDVWFSTDGTNWVKVVTPTIWAARTLHSSLVLGTKLFVFGGSAGGREVWHTLDGSNWIQDTAAAFSSARYGMATCVYNGLLWAVGGFDGGYLTQVWSSPDGIAWTQLTAAYGGTGLLSATLTAFKAPPGNSVIDAPTLWLMGGSDVTPTFQNKIWWSTINGTLSTSYAIPTTAPTPQPLQASAMGGDKYFLLKDSYGLYVWYANELRKVSDTNYPQLTVPGIAVLDETAYVMDATGLISGSSIRDPFTWPSQNFIGADYRPDPGVWIGLYNNYVMALGTGTLQLLYNSGAPGHASLLRPVKSANQNIGCAFPNTVVEMENTVVWVGRTDQLGRQVFAMQGSVPVPISDSFVEKILDSESGAANARATCIKIRGHAFYILTLPTPNLTIAYDFVTKTWAQWTYGSGLFSFSFHADDGIFDYFLADGVKITYVMYFGFRDDDGVPIKAMIRTNPIDHGVDNWKTIPRASLIVDRVIGASVGLRYSDDDYQTWSPLRTLTVNDTRCTTIRLGRYRRRAYEITHEQSSNFRISELREFGRIGNN